jgi:hypothetical protein
MPRERWKLINSATRGPDLDAYGEPVFLAGGQGFSLLAELARDPTNGLVKIAPGFYRVDKYPRAT